jgi:hypothetical protein
VPVTGDMVSVMGKRWNKPDYLVELLEAEDAPELIKFWRSPVYREKFYNVPAFLLPRLAEMATEVATEFRTRIPASATLSRSSNAWPPSHMNGHATALGSAGDELEVPAGHAIEIRTGPVHASRKATTCSADAVR